MFILYLKSIEMQGFKSFPEKTRLAFEKPITGIVGPNGSGKSNISDAILWVMGEQSTKTLRGGKMEDVVFGGTQRRPQLGYAEVSLILDNSGGRLDIDSTEIMITRRYYRSGESEYYINRAIVRLKDVNELFMDTGLGREGYSIIGQGKIAEILSTKSKDRRDIFEEAAGISRYRHRKEESERKLSMTEDNLLRIGDKISEIELQIDPLREQAEVAKRYLLLRDELRGLEISMWLRDLDSLKARAEKASADHITAKASLEASRDSLNKCFEDSETLSEKTRHCDIEAESVRELTSSAETRQNEVNNEISVLRSRMEGNSGQIDNLSTELQSQDGREDSVRLQIGEREQRLSEIAEAQNANEDRSAAVIAELQDVLDSAGESSAAQGALVNDENNKQKELSESRQELSALASQAQELYDKDSSVKQELSAALDTRAGETAAYDARVAGLEKAREEAASLANVVNGLRMKQQNRVKKEEASRENLDRVTLEIKTLESRRGVLAAMEKEYQGYSRAVKLIMQDSARGAIRNIHGTIAGLVSAEDKYAIAIETALGGAMQNIIVDTEEDGKAAINLLKRRDAGRATFLPLSTINGSVLSEKSVGGDDGFEGVAFDLVKFDGRYTGIYSYLLGRVIIADDLNNAIKIARRHGHKYKLVTLDGQVINAGGSMTGGSTVANAGMLSRANELKQLAKRIDALSEDLSKATREHAECVREKNAAVYELETARAELNAAENAVILQENDERHHAQLLKALQDAINSYESEIDSLSDRIKLNGKLTEDARENIRASEQELQSIKNSIAELLRGQEALSVSRERIGGVLSELRAESAALDAEKNAIARTVFELSAMRDEIFGSRERQIETIDGLKALNDEIRAAILEKERFSLDVQKEIDSHKDRLARINKQKLEIEAKRSALNKTIQEKNSEVLDLDRECSRLEQKKLAAEMEERQIVDKLWDTYELSRSNAASSGAPIESAAQAGKRISALKREISELGNPNIGAIDEFERVNARYTFLTSQRDDVENAKKEILSVIDEVTIQMRDIFTREFAVINESFEKTFKELFGGGRASLILEDPDDVLNCGVDIRVQPPGKSLKTLTLLSGGEKAFVAIAIYFAILSVRPPPFVVMDEIEAALDDANVLRFADYMRGMSNSTQMIVISHKRATMEEADVLYGVTMQEMGVSSILRIDLEEAEKHFAKPVRA